MTLAGAMTVAKQGLVIAELIDRGIVNAIVFDRRADGTWSWSKRLGARISGINPSSATRNSTKPDTTASTTPSNPKQNLDDVGARDGCGVWRLGFRRK